MRGFLLDTNHLDAHYHNDPRFMKSMASYPVDWLLRTCNIVLGELESGHLITKTTDQAKRDDYDRFINETYLTLSLPVSTTTRLYYGQIVSRIFHKYPRPGHDLKTEAYLASLGVQINDVWIVAIAWEHNLTVLTTDKMEKIREAVGEEVRFENWLEDPPLSPAKAMKKWLSS